MSLKYENSSKKRWTERRFNISFAGYKIFLDLRAIFMFFKKHEVALIKTNVCLK